MRASVLAMAIVLVGCAPAQTPDVEAGSETEASAAADESAPLATPLGGVEINTAALASAQPGQRIELNLGAAGRVTSRTIGVDRLDGGRFSWRAATIAEGAPDGEATLIVDGAAVTGSVRTPDGVLYRIRPSENGNTLERVDTTQMPPD